MNKELFTLIMNQIKENENNDDAVCSLLEHLYPSEPSTSFIYSRNINTLYAILSYFYSESIMDTIYYFTCDLNWGRKWVPGSKSDDGVDVPLRTLDDLYGYCESHN